MQSGKKLLSVLMSVVLAIGLVPVSAFAAQDGGGNGLAAGLAALSASPQATTAQAAGAVSRGEWVGKLVETFDITVTDEDEYPEDYFSDLDSGNAHYYDFLKAVDFGIVDVAAGDPVCPDDPATREFAAQTLNFCLGFQLDEGAAYTYSDIAETEYDDDLQVAVNRNWFALSGGKVLPAQSITVAESSKMLADATEVWHSTDGLDGMADDVELASGVKEVPRGTEAVLSDDGATVAITDCPVTIKSGDTFAVYFGDDLPVAYEAGIVSRKGNVTTVVVTAADPSEAYDSLVYGEEEEVDLNDFQEDEGVSTQMHADVSAAAASGVNTGGFTVRKLKAQGVSYKNGTLSYSKSFGPGTVSGAIAGMKVHKSVDVVRNKYYVSVSGTASLTASVKGSVDFSLPIGAVWCAGCTSTFSVVAKAEGSISKTVSANFETGVQYDPSNGWRLVKTFRKGKPGVTATANAHIGFDANMAVGVPGISAKVGVDFGFEANYQYDRYGSGTPKVCQDIEGHLYAGAYATATVGSGKLIKPLKKRFDVWTANNSPVRLHKHIEDGKTVGSCSRGKKYTYKYWRTGSSGSKWGHLLNGSNGSSTGWGYNAAGEWVEYATYEYELDDDENAVITKYHGNTRALVIPDTIDGYKVVGIGDSSFEGNSYLTTVSIPDSVTEIESGAFARCPRLSAVSLPKSLKRLGYDAFYDDDSIASVTVPKALEECEELGWRGPFAGCDGLRGVTFEAGATRVASHLLEGCPGVESVAIPATVTSVDYEAFCDCENLASVSIPDSVTEIESGAFARCPRLKKVVLPDSVESMGENVFKDCTGLAEVHIPDKRINLMAGTFSGCASLTTVNMPTTLEAIRNNAFHGCESLKKLAVPNKVTTIEYDAFSDCAALEDISIPDSVTKIGSRAFSNCDSLKKIVLPNSVASLGSGVFQDCDALADVTLSTGVTVIPSEAFQHCDTLTSIILPYRIAEIEEDAFAECVKLASVTIPRATEEIADNAFSYPKKMTIYGVAGTPAEEYASDKGAKFVAQDIPATSIKLTPSEGWLFDGESAYIVADIQPMNFTGEVTWKSSNTNIATVEPDGLVNAVGVGSTTIKLVVGDQAASFKITVRQPVTSIWLNKYSLSLEGGQTSKLTADVYPSDAYNKAIEWSSSDTSVAKVDQNGKVTAVKKGKATITAKAKDGSGAYDTCDVTVTCNVTKATAVGQLESPHPYEKNCADVWTYTVSGASALDVTFDKRTATEEGSDYIRVYTGGKVLVGSYTGAALAGKTVKVPGDTVRIKLESDAALNDWGFKVTSVKASSLAISSATVPAIASRAYNGKAYNPKPTVKYGKTTLKPDADYTISYLNASKKDVAAAKVVGAGTYYVKISGKGKYSGAKNVAFKVTQAANPMSVAPKTASVKYSKKKAQTVKASAAYSFKKAAAGAKTFTRVASGSSKWLPKVDPKTGAITVKAGAPRGKVQSVKVKVAAKGNGNYKSASKTITVKVRVK